MLHARPLLLLFIDKAKDKQLLTDFAPVLSTAGCNCGLEVIDMESVAARTQAVFHLGHAAVLCACVSVCVYVCAGVENICELKMDL